MSDQVLPPPLMPSAIILSAIEFMDEPYSSFFKDLSQDMDEIISMSEKPDFKFYKSALILANAILEANNNQESE